MAAGITDKPLSDEEVNEVGNMIADQFSDYIRTVIEKI
jgi:purine nucleoside phosphorylase